MSSYIQETTNAWNAIKNLPTSYPDRAGLITRLLSADEQPTTSKMKELLQSPCRCTDFWARLAEVLKAPGSDTKVEDGKVAATMLAIIAMRAYCKDVMSYISENEIGKVRALEPLLEAGLQELGLGLDGQPGEVRIYIT